MHPMTFLFLGRDDLLDLLLGFGLALLLLRCLLPWGLQLVTNGNSFSCPDELGKIGVKGMVGEAGHI